MSRLLLTLTLLLAACGEKPVEPTDRMPDQCLRAELFLACMRALPAGPATTQYNDWDEVVQACASAAFYQSLRLAESIKPECRA